LLTLFSLLSDNSANLPQSHLDFQTTPQEFISEDTTQDDILLSVLPTRYLTPQDCENKYRRMRPTDVNLSTLQRWYDNGQVDVAVSSLQYRNNLVIDADYLVDRDDVGDLLFPVTHEEYLDLLFVVGSDRGFHALTPHQSQSNTFPWILDLRSTARAFTCRDFDLGLDPSNSMMWLGKMLKENVWLILSTLQYLDYKRTASDTGGCSVIQERVRRLLVYLLMSALASSKANRLRVNIPPFTSTIDDVAWDSICDGFKYVNFSPNSQRGWLPAVRQPHAPMSQQ
jgi:hypothetical protein